MAATSSGRHFGGSKNLFADRKYCRENTLFVNVRDNSSVKPEEIIEFINDNCGVGSLLACVPKSGNLYEITLEGKAPLQYLLEGIKIGNNTFECHEVVPSSIVVSFMHLPAYIDDNEIEATLRSMGVELLSPINRRFYPGTTIADGTRYAKVKLPDSMTSFPYTIKFRKEYYRCIHNGQLKVCSLCYSSEHLFRACPDFKCFKCKKQGHYAKTCKSTRCKQCGQWEHRCSCQESEHEDNDISEGEMDTREVNNGDNNDVHSDGDTEAPEGDQGISKGTPKRDQEISEGTPEGDQENGEEAPEGDQDKTENNDENTENKETKNENNPPITTDTEMCDCEESSTAESDPDTEVTVKNAKKRKSKVKNKSKAKKNK